MTDGLGVVVPARDEEEHVAGCLSSVIRAAEHPLVASIPLNIVMVLDSCTDRTADVVERTWRQTRQPSDTRPMDLTVVEANHGAVGLARAAGCAAALDGLAGLPDDRIWIATTDADSEVPYNWLAYQMSRHAGGVGGWAGTVRVAEWDQQPAGAREWFDRLYRNDIRVQRHVHAANLGFTAAAYRDIGGFAGVACSEDHALYEALDKAGHRVVADWNAPVLTSARREGRAPGGFSDTLRGYRRCVDGATGEVSSGSRQGSTGQRPRESEMHCGNRQFS